MNTENQRFNQAIEYLINQGDIKYAKELAEQINLNPDRVKYLRKDNGGSLNEQEINSLQEKFPQISWGPWVKLGQGSMLGSYNQDPQPQMVKEASIIYKKNPDHQLLLNSILTGNSTLPESEQKKILVKEVLTLQQKVIDVYESTNPLKMFEDLKKMFKG